MTEPLISLRHLSKFFSVDTNLFGRTTSVLKAVDDLSLDIYPGETFGLVGESGCGKTTVGKMLVSLYEPTAGEIWYQGKDLTKLTTEGPARGQPRHPAHLPGPVLVAQSAHDGGRHHLRADPRQQAPAREQGGRARQLPAQRRGPLGERPQPLRTRVLGRAAPADRHRPRACHGAEAHRVRRAGLGARRVGAGAGAQPALGPVQRVRADVPVHRPRPERGQARERPGRRHVPGTPRRGRAQARALPEPAAPLHQGAPLGDPGHESGPAQGAHPARGHRGQPDRPRARLPVLQPLLRQGRLRRLRLRHR